MMPALVAGLIVVGAVGGFFATRSAEAVPTTTRLQAAAASVATSVSARLQADGLLLTAAANSIAGDPAAPDSELQRALQRAAPADRVVAIARSGPDAAPAVVVAAASASRLPSVVGLDLAGRVEWRVALSLARDRAAPSAVVTTGADGQPMVLDALPLFGTLDVPADISDRRRALKGFVVTLTDASAMVGLAPSEESDVSVRVIDGAAVLDVAGRGGKKSPPGSTFDAPISANAVAWTVQTWSSPQTSTLPWFVLAGGIVLAAVAAALVASRERSIASAVAESEARNEELALVARAGPLLQQSLALGDLLPAFIVEISDELDLDSTAISLVDEGGAFRRVFSLGSGLNAPETDLAVLTSAPEFVLPGEMVTVPLQRVGRVVGAFQARAVTGLSPPQMKTLQAVCALLASAIGNVRLFQDEQEMVARLRDVDRIKTSFIGSVSHELRTSVTAIQGFAGLLEGDGAMLDDERRADYVERIGRNARSLGILVEDLLDFARFERSGLTAALRPIDLSDLVPKVVEQMSSVLGGRPVSVVVEPNVIALADTLAVERVLANLLSNAGKYTPPDSEVTVGLERLGGEAVLCVTDKGPGVAPEEREKIFELFYRSDESARVTRGVGIGLALTRQLVLHLNGTIVVEDGPGGGARFRVTIPLADAVQTAAVPDHSEPAPRRAGG